MLWALHVYCYYQLMVVLAIDVALQISKSFPSGVYAWLVFTSTALFALISPSQDYSYGLNDLLMLIAGIHVIEYTMSNKEKGEDSHHGLFSVAQ